MNGSCVDLRSYLDLGDANSSILAGDRLGDQPSGPGVFE